MNRLDKSSISAVNRYFITNSGIISSLRYNFSATNTLLQNSFLLYKNVGFLMSDKVNFTYHQILNEDLGKTVRLYKTFDLQPSFKSAFKCNVPNMYRCQNCETIYRTRYQFQRHQCEFNADKVVLKTNADVLDIENSKDIKYDCSTCGKQFVSKNNLERHQTSHENAKVNTCEHCKKQFVSENRLRIHKENHCKKAGEISKFYRSDLIVWKCKKCNEVFSSSSTAAYHVDDCTELVDSSIIKREALTETENIDLRTTEKISTEILLQCEFCNRVYADKQILLKHQKTHKTNKNYECVICKEVFDSYVFASQHWQTRCSDKVNFFYLPKLTYCEFCDRTFKSHELLYTHKIKKQHYTPKIYESVAPKSIQAKDIKNEDVMDKLIEDVLMALKVPISKRRKIEKTDDKESIQPLSSGEIIEITTETLSQSGLESNGAEQKKRQRKRKYSQQQPRVTKPCVMLNEGFKYQCERCTDIWSSITELETHRKMEHAANFNCDECGQVLDSARALLIHSRTHKSLKPYVCETCGRSYSQTSHLWQHMRFHQGIKPFACPHEDCEARYTIRPDLKDHIRKVHTRERPFKCSVCGKCFLTGSVFYQHRLIHTEDRRYTCDFCEKRFFRADALNNHRRIHTNERPYPCFVCGKCFRQKGDRKKHYKTQHPNAILN